MSQPGPSPSLRNDINGKLLRTTTEQAQLEIRTSRPVLQEEYAKWGQLLTPNSLIGSLWNFCSDIGITSEDSSLTDDDDDKAQLVAKEGCQTTS
jgi:hypothetical protein